MVFGLFGSSKIMFVVLDQQTFCSQAYDNCMSKIIRFGLSCHRITDKHFLQALNGIYVGINSTKACLSSSYLQPANKFKPHLVSVLLNYFLHIVCYKPRGCVISLIDSNIITIAF